MLWLTTRRAPALRAASISTGVTSVRNRLVGPTVRS